jgi:twitching motility two-component system response regulator PilH
MPKILIVDDLPTEQQYLREVVTRLGHACITASDGEQAVELAKKEQPNIILLDVVLPKQDGFQACRKIKTDPETAGIPVLLISSKSQQSDEYWGLKQGASAYLRKPVKPEHLAALITKHLAA